MVNPIKVLVVDDSQLVRDLLVSELSKDPMIQIVGTASNPYEARDQIVALKPQVMTLDVEMPRMTGVEFLKKLMPQCPIPTIMVSSLTEKGASVTLEALAAGAVDFVAKPGNAGGAFSSMILELSSKIKIACNVDVSSLKRGRQAAFPHMRNSVAPSQSLLKLIAIGASTGGTEAIANIMQQFPNSLPPIVITQHMPAGFTKMFAERLNRACAMEVREAQDGDILTSGVALVAPGGWQLRVVKSGTELRVMIKDREQVSGHAPSVDYMFASVAQNVGKNCIGIILTGMGADGAKGLKMMREAGAKTLGQDEASCVVYGMPKVAYEVGAVEKQLPLHKIAEETLSLLTYKVAA